MAEALKWLQLGEARTVETQKNKSLTANLQRICDEARKYEGESDVVSTKTKVGFYLCPRTKSII